MLDVRFSMRYDRTSLEWLGYFAAIKISLGITERAEVDSTVVSTSQYEPFDRSGRNYSVKLVKCVLLKINFVGVPLLIYHASRSPFGR